MKCGLQPNRGKQWWPKLCKSGPAKNKSSMIPPLSWGGILGAPPNKISPAPRRRHGHASLPRLVWTSLQTLYLDPSLQHPPPSSGHRHTQGIAHTGGRHWCVLAPSLQVPRPLPFSLLPQIGHSFSLVKGHAEQNARRWLAVPRRKLCFPPHKQLPPSKGSPTAQCMPPCVTLSDPKLPAPWASRFSTTSRLLLKHRGGESPCEKLRALRAPEVQLGVLMCQTIIAHLPPSPGSGPWPKCQVSLARDPREPHRPSHWSETLTRDEAGRPPDPVPILQPFGRFAIIGAAPWSRI